MMQWTDWRTGLLLIVFVSLITFAVSEEFFHSRNREDNVQYRTMEDKNIVTSTEKAETKMPHNFEVKFSVSLATCIESGIHDKDNIDELLQACARSTNNVLRCSLDVNMNLIAPITSCLPLLMQVKRSEKRFFDRDDFASGTSDDDVQLVSCCSDVKVSCPL
ncbi:hypothetical protein HNY73_020505 [Argiope bruennichi]|uniref:Uncharacterized protein n=1 Tax=Argiope bruennichi TaxID=94029 RepID=A0A8T0E843_ARGBR|nr:hypothetical protein HNY73_020505 [Argiope bruennichi]